MNLQKGFYFFYIHFVVVVTVTAAAAVAGAKRDMGILLCYVSFIFSSSSSVYS
jgi:hypothetical protein